MSIEGSLIGLAVGDALGAPVEFLDLRTIRARYGEAGIADLEPWGGVPAGSYTDDTQMSLSTAQGIIRAFRERGAGTDFHKHLIESVYEEYLRWFKNQSLAHERRAPGNTCLSALASGRMGTAEHPINDSKGCGGVMRTAPVGLVFSGTEAFRIGTDCAAITHGHPSGYLTAGFIAELISYLLEGKRLVEGIDLCLDTLKGYGRHDETTAKLSLVLHLAAQNIAPVDAIPKIGAGWVAEEALAIAVFCALRFEDNFRGGVLAAVNHSGDSDSTGSITGAILGAKLGVASIPARWVQRLENSAKIKQIAKGFSLILEGSEIKRE